jgi:hypothetical protein
VDPDDAPLVQQHPIPSPPRIRSLGFRRRRRSSSSSSSSSGGGGNALAADATFIAENIAAAKDIMMDRFRAEHVGGHVRTTNSRQRCGVHHHHHHHTACIDHHHLHHTGAANVMARVATCTLRAGTVMPNVLSHSNEEINGNGASLHPHPHAPFVLWLLLSLSLLVLWLLLSLSLLDRNTLPPPQRQSTLPPPQRRSCVAVLVSYTLSLPATVARAVERLPATSGATNASATWSLLK